MSNIKKVPMLWMVLHHHSHGTDPHVFHWAGGPAGPSEKAVIKACDIDFDDKEWGDGMTDSGNKESLEIYNIGTSIPSIKPRTWFKKRKRRGGKR